MILFSRARSAEANSLSGWMPVEDYLRPAAIHAGVLKVKDGITYVPNDDSVKRFGFHVLGRSLAAFLMDAAENPRSRRGNNVPLEVGHDSLYSHSNRKQKRAV